MFVLRLVWGSKKQLLIWFPVNCMIDTEQSTLKLVTVTLLSTNHIACCRAIQVFIVGCKTEECEEKLKQDCKLYNINYNSLKLKYTYNKNAAWGSRDTCNNDGKLF